MREQQRPEGGAVDEWSPGLGERWGSLAAPAVVAALCGLAALALRSAIPPDEVRYLHVLSESRDHLSFLTMTGKPYAEKPPLLFWIAWLLSRTGLSPDLAMRVIPGLCAGFTVWLVGRPGRRLGLHPTTSWLQGAMFLPFFFSQYLRFDPLLTVFVWAVVVCWRAGADRRAAAFSALALLAKGPVALLPIAALPLMPVLALCAGAVLQRQPTAARRLRDGLVAQHALFLLLCGWALFAAERIAGKYGESAVALSTSPSLRALLAVGFVSNLVAAALVGSGRLRARAALAVAILLATLTLAPIHVFAGRALLPREVTRVLLEADASTPIFIVGNTNDGLFHWLSGREDIEAHTGKDGLERFLRERPLGLVLVPTSTSSRRAACA